MPTTSAVPSVAVGMKNLPRARARRGGGRSPRQHARSPTMRQPRDLPLVPFNQQDCRIAPNPVARGLTSEVPVAGFGQRNLFPGGIDEADTSALLDIADRGYRQAKLLREAADLVGGIERSGKQQLVIVACGREVRRQIGIGGGELSRRRQ